MILDEIKINPEVRDALWNPDKCLSIFFNRCWKIDLLSKFLEDNFKGIKYLQLICNNYMTNNDSKPYNFKDFPKTITHFYLKC